MRVGYVLQAFPKLSESFVLGEVSELLNDGVNVQVLSATRPNGKIVHDKYGCYDYNQRSHYYKQGSVQPFELLNSRGVSCLLSRPVFQNPKNKLRCKLIAEYFSSISKKLNVDLFHAHFASEAAEIAMSLSQDTGIPFTFTVHAYDLYQNSKTVHWFAKKELLLTLCNEAAEIVAISNYNKAFLCKLGVDESKIKVVHCGVDPDEFRRTTPYKASKQILCVARLTEKKGLRYLIEALGYLSKESSTKLLIVGTGPEEQTLRHLINQPKLKGRIQFLGDVHDNELLDLYEKSALFVLPCVVSSDGDRDSIPVALIEAMSMELPVISTSVSGIPELVKDGENGLLVKPKDSQSLAAAIEKLLYDPETCERMGKEGRKTIQDQFNIKKSASALKEIFQDVSS
jgi:glycosyltransferase involved in cell wall biosynthesis